MHQETAQRLSQICLWVFLCSLSLTRPSTEQEQAGFLFCGTSPPSAMHHFIVVRMGSPRVDVMLIHPPQSWRRPRGHCLPTCSSRRPQDSALTEPKILFLPWQICLVTPDNFLRPTLSLVLPRVHLPRAMASPFLGPSLPTLYTEQRFPSLQEPFFMLRLCTPVFLLGESQGRGTLVGCHLWGRTESDLAAAMPLITPDNCPCVLCVPALGTRAPCLGRPLRQEPWPC